MKRQGQVFSFTNGKAQAAKAESDAGSSNCERSNAATVVVAAAHSATPVTTVGPGKRQIPSERTKESAVGAYVMGTKQSKPDVGRKDKPRESKTTMSKKFISKSQDNLSSQKKSKPLSIVPESPRPRDNAASIARAEAVRADKNKEGTAVVKEEKKNSTFAKPKPVKPVGQAGNLSKTSSTQSVDNASQSSTSLKPVSTRSSSNPAIKRAQSTQNVSKESFMRKRISAPADVMAYNAELLANFEKEKKVLEGRISELAKLAENRKGEIEKNKYEIKRLKEKLACPKEMEEFELLKNQNRQLLDRLQELGFPPEQITDSEKLMMKLSRAPSQGSNSDACLKASASCDSLATDGSGARAGTRSKSVSSTGGGGGRAMLAAAAGSGLNRSTSLSASEPGMSLLDLCGIPEQSLDAANWDKQSNKSASSDVALSEVSVACLTERILQMEETNYSTAEELQATLQELGDLQDLVNELTGENTKLINEKDVLLESLCKQTEKLENTRIQLEQLKCLLITGDLPDKSEIDGHLVDLLKSAQEEREELMRKQIEWSNALQGLENECKETRDTWEILQEKYSVLEDTHECVKAERDGLEKQLKDVREAQAMEQLEVNRLRSLLENERCKVAELEMARGSREKTDLEALLDTARQDKDKTEQKVADLVESLALSQCEVTRLKESISSKEQELTVASNNVKSQVADLQFRLEVVEKDKLEAARKEKVLREHVDQLEADNERHLEDKKNLTVKLQEIQAELRSFKQQKQTLEMELQEISSRHSVESEEWKQFQRDLQTAVVIANNFSQETEKEMEKLTMDNVQLQEKLLLVEMELDKLQQENKILKQAAEELSTRKHSIFTNAELKGKVLSSVDRGLASLRESRPHLDRQNSQSYSVKSVIRSIEEQVKSGCSSAHSNHSGSRRSSASSDILLTPLKDLVQPPSPLATLDCPRSPVKDFGFTTYRSLSVDKSPQPRQVAVGSPMSAGSSPDVSGKGSRLDSSESSPGKIVSQISSILKDRSVPRRGSGILEVDMSKKETLGRDPLSSLAKLMKGSKRNALLKWCQIKTVLYPNVDITNFSSSWNDGLGFCALLHCYVPEKIPWSELTTENKRRNFSIAFNAGESIGIKATLNINDMVSMERPDWQAVMNYVTSIYRHFEVDKS